MVFCSNYSNAQKIVKIKPIKKIKMLIPEPSDVALSFEGNSLFVVSDKGMLFETDLDGKIIRKANNYFGLDCEGVYADKNFVYVAEEFSRRIAVFSVSDFSLIKMITIPYHGARNKGYEAITYNPTTKKFLLFIEKDPAKIFELDENFNKVNEIDISKLAIDISGASYHNGFLWLLSDEDQKIMKLDPSNYRVLAAWKIPILNPEGITFTKDGKLIIMSDGMKQMFYFNSID